MRVKRRRRPGSNGTAPITLSPAKDSTGKATEYDLTAVPPQPATSLALGEREPFECPFCGSRDANATAKLDRDGEPRLFIGCFNGDCAIPRRQYLPALSQALGIDGATREQIAAKLLEQIDFDGALNLSRAVVGIVTSKYRRP
jgi:hypothetical protein